MLWAWGPDDPTPGVAHDFHLSYHGSNELSRGAKGIRMTSKQIQWKYPDDEEKYPYGIQQYDFVNSNVSSWRKYKINFLMIKPPQNVI